MSDLIKLLPDAVANQIAAGEVIQRPASVLKELMENAIDAGATEIKVLIKDAGRTLIQVTDNGCGISGEDAAVAFERHATSKIRSADDLFAIRSLGFRGEALASVAAVAEVSLKTRRKEDELGTLLDIHGSEIKGSEAVSCAAGSNFSVRNLFYNVPARRKFLKSNSTEFRHIINEFNRVALTNTEVAFQLVHNESEIYSLPPSQVKQRILNIFGKNINQVLIPLQTDTNMIRIQGYIGKPEAARKSFGEQFFFVNKRYIRHSFFHKAMMEAYEQVLPPETIPSYFLYFEVPTESIDINIHPTKTEVKFEDERSLYQILHASVREVLGKNAMVPSLDFDREGDIEIPVLSRGTEIKIPSEKFNPDYNPFHTEPGYQKRNHDNWESLYQDLDTAERSISETLLEPRETASGVQMIQFKNRYILLPVKSGLMVIDQKRAHERILYEQLLRISQDKDPATQRLLYPKTVRLDAADHALIIELFDDICSLGFDIRKHDGYSLEVKGVPSDPLVNDPEEWLLDFLHDFKENETDIKAKRIETIAAGLASSRAIQPGQSLKLDEMREITDQLFACGEPGQSPRGKTIFRMIPMGDIEKMFN